MLPSIRKLGNVLLHIYDYHPGLAIYLPEVVRYEAETPCIVGDDGSDEASFHQTCLQYGFKSWLNVAVVSDTCDTVVPATESSLIAAFNKDCQEGGWLWKMMNYRRHESSCEPTLSPDKLPRDQSGELPGAPTI
jgi:hypothetical protein